VLPARTQKLAVDIEVTDPETRFEVGVLQINQIAIRPTDPDANDAIGNTDIGLLSAPIEVGYGVEPDTLPTPALSDGTYQVVSMAVNPILFSDNDPPPAMPSGCADYVAFWGWFSDMSLSNFGRDVYVTVENGSVNSLGITVKGQEFLTAFQEAWTCQSSGCFGGAPYCLGNFNSASFTSRASEFLVFE
jgi:hypothetical protein